MPVPSKRDPMAPVRRPRGNDGSRTVTGAAGAARVHVAPEQAPPIVRFFLHPRPDPNGHDTAQDWSALESALDQDRACADAASRTAFTTGDYVRLFREYAATSGGLPPARGVVVPLHEGSVRLVALGRRWACIKHRPDGASNHAIYERLLDLPHFVSEYEAHMARRNQRFAAAHRAVVRRADLRLAALVPDGSAAPRQ